MAITIQRNGCWRGFDFIPASRRDASAPEDMTKGIGPRKTPELLISELAAPSDGRPPLALPIFAMDHQPKQLSELSDCGVDLDLSGHTHDGQLFPANLLVRAAWENAQGPLKKGGMYSVVTSGLGVWGPICVFSQTAKLL